MKSRVFLLIESRTRSAVYQRLQVQTLSAVCLLAFILHPSAAHAQAGISAEAAASTGLHAERNYFSPLPYEHFDPSNGNVVLSFVDLELPGWTDQMIKDAVRLGKQVPTTNVANGNPAIRFIHPSTGQSVVIDMVTKTIIHVGGKGFLY